MTIKCFNFVFQITNILLFYIRNKITCWLVVSSSQTRRMFSVFATSSGTPILWAVESLCWNLNNLNISAGGIPLHTQFVVSDPPNFHGTELLFWVLVARDIHHSLLLQIHCISYPTLYRPSGALPCEDRSNGSHTISFTCWTVSGIKSFYKIVLRLTSIDIPIFFGIVFI